MIFFVSNVQAGSGANYSAYGFASDFNPQANYASNAIEVNEVMAVRLFGPTSTSIFLENAGTKYKKKRIRRQESKRGKRRR